MKRFATIETKGADTWWAIFRDDPSPICGKLWTELSTAKVPIISGIKIDVKLKMAGDAWRIWTNDTEKYKVIIAEAVLHVPVSTIHPLEWEKITKRLIKDNIRIHFKRLECHAHPITKGSATWNSDGIVRSSLLPAKILLVFLSTDSFLGNYGKNGLEFVRQWDVMGPGVARSSPRRPRAEAEEPPSRPSAPTFTEEEEQHLKAAEEIAKRHNLALRIKSFFSRARDVTPPPTTSAQATMRDEEVGRQSREACPPYSRTGEETEDDDEEDEFADPAPVVLRQCFIKDIRMTLGGNNIDSFRMEMDAKDALIDYVRTCYFNGTLDSPFSHSLDYEDFLRSYFICSWDLTTSYASNLTFLTPATRFGHLRLHLVFSEALPEEVTMLCFQQYATEMTINSKKQVGFSYLNVTAT
jgi:hypothetical protein